MQGAYTLSLEAEDIPHGIWNGVEEITSYCEGSLLLEHYHNRPKMSHNEIWNKVEKITSHYTNQKNNIPLSQPMNRLLIRKWRWKYIVQSWKFLRVDIHRWANFPWFFQKGIRQFPFFCKSDSPKFYSIKLCYPKNHQKKYRDYIKSLEIWISLKKYHQTFYSLHIRNS